MLLAAFKPMPSPITPGAATVEKLARFHAIVAQHNASADQGERQTLRAEGSRLRRELVLEGGLRLYEFHAAILGRLEANRDEFVTSAELAGAFGYDSWRGAFVELEEMRFIRRQTVRGCKSAVVVLTPLGEEFLAKVDRGELVVRPAFAPVSQ
jgi:hypothetical protein